MRLAKMRFRLASAGSGWLAFIQLSIIALFDSQLSC